MHAKLFFPDFFFLIKKNGNLFITSGNLPHNEKKLGSA